MSFEKKSSLKLNYFLHTEITSMTKEELALQGVFGLQTCKSKHDAKEILLDMWTLSEHNYKSWVVQQIKEMRKYLQHQLEHLYDRENYSSDVAYFVCKEPEKMKEDETRMLQTRGIELNAQIKLLNELIKRLEK